MNKGLVFGRYNHLRKIARENPEAVDAARLNRALGIALSPKAQAADAQEYHPATCDCGCKDWQYKDARKRKNVKGECYTGPCKHQLAAMLLA